METLVVFAPLIGALICGFGWKFIGENPACWVATGLLFFSAILSWILFLNFDGVAVNISILRWIESGSLSTDWAIRFDRLTAIMFIVITTVSSLVHLYSFGYMKDDINFNKNESYRPRFYAYLSFFTFTMLALVSSNNLLQMFFGWEGVGVASYLLIGFYYKKSSANSAAIKAFVVNRVGDFGFLLGIFALYFMVGSINLTQIFQEVPEIANIEIRFLWRDWNAANLIALLLFLGAMGKSAQLFLHVWLPDAMEGPTPVSALIHAATMVTAGVFLVCRMSPLMEFAPAATNVIVIVGAATAFFAATVGLVQNDIKRVIAYSTCSQLGYMFVAAGLGAYSVAMFHLLTHAFFKAMLFLGAGSVIHAMHHEQDMRSYGGLRKKIPYTFWAMMIGTLAITGVGIPLTHFGFAGFLSKDAIIESAYGAGSNFSFWILITAACFTSFYSWRLMFLTFYGDPRGDIKKHDHAHESPTTMLVPLAVLAVGAVFSGMIFFKPFFGDHHEIEKFFGIPTTEINTLGGNKNYQKNSFLVANAKVKTNNDEDHSISDPSNKKKVEEETKIKIINSLGEGAIFIGSENHVIEKAHHVPKWVKVSPFLAMIIGFGTAWLFYIKDISLPRRLANQQKYIYKFLINKWYFDEVYELIFVRSSKKLGKIFWIRGDGNIIDGTINGIALSIIPFCSRIASKIQSGFIFHYAFVMILGVLVLITWFAIGIGS